ncbi:hypothetical protein [Paraflavitalea sp. CAU 1676]|uniref:hypothetical protein n=1 Tax=Paraflavitalea sp. CAU 1676 TaxID=3032598 RepID=UPI0023DBA357|nr:hypothetical protein [Paraflavitalea sp. CAU 1676]MDF2192161.1 hypothetical protein [Paraflavitalea sp. CAU 1676]
MWEHLYTTNEFEKANLSINAFELEGIAGFVYPEPAGAPVMLYRSYNPKNGIHLLSSLQEYNYVLNFLGFVGDGQVGFIYPLPTPGTVQLSRLRNPDHGDYLYTINEEEKANAINVFNYVDEGPAGFVYAAPSPGINTPLFRSYNSVNNDHFYTTDENEHRHAVNNLGFRNEHIACHLPMTSHPSIIPLYRCHRRDPFDFFYSTNITEITHAINNLNYSWEGIVGYVDAVPADNNIPFLRMYHPGRGDHFYTTDDKDHTNAINLGYVDEGTACNIFSVQVEGSIPLFRLLHVFDAIVHVNIIGVGGDVWPNSQWTLFRNGFMDAAAILRPHGMRLNLVTESLIRQADADGHEDIDDDDEARDLTHEWSVPNFAVDVFGVSTYAGETAGFSAVDGSCDKSYPCQMNGSVVEVRAAIPVGVVMAHEICHYLGLEHRDEGLNLMRKFGAMNTTLLEEDQVSKIKEHCFVRKLNYPS